MKLNQEIQDFTISQDCNIAISETMAGSLMWIGVDILDEISPYEEDYKGE